MKIHFDDREKLIWTVSQEAVLFDGLILWVIKALQMQGFCFGLNCDVCFGGINEPTLLQQLRSLIFTGCTAEM